MDSQDVGRDLEAVQALQRKQETLEREMTTVEAKLKDHNRDSYKLIQKYPDDANHIQHKIQDVTEKWNELLTLKERRQKMLAESYTRQKFFSDLKDLELWVADTIKKMESKHKIASAGEAEAQLELHAERKAEIDGRQEAFKTLIEFGKKLAEKDPEILKSVDKVIALQAELNEAWNKHKQELTHEYQIQGLIEQADQLENWIASKEAFLNNEDIGDSLRAVETLIRKHQDFETMLRQQLVRVSEFEKIVEGILKDKAHDNTEIEDTLEAIVKRKERLLQTCETRRKRLEESRALHEFIRNIHEVENWLVQKIQISQDENYRDPSNLQSKIQKHAAFDAEISANATRIQSVINEGENLIYNNHFASKEIKDRIMDLDNDYKHLQELSALKQDRLRDAYQALLFNRSLDEFEVWISEVELQLQSSDYGTDLASVNNLLKRHNALEIDVSQHTENCETINEGAEEFMKSNHFMAEKLYERAHKAIARFHQLQIPLQNRRDQLEASFMLHQFTRDVEDELQWLTEREPLASSEDLGEFKIIPMSVDLKADLFFKYEMLL